MNDEKLEQIKKEIKQGLAKNRHALLYKFPFIGNLLMRMDLIPVRDWRCRTACTDGTKIYFDCDFYMGLNENDRIFVLAHEISHCMMLHLVRLQTRNPDLFNIATDMEVNYMLSSQDAKYALTPPANLCFPPKQLEGKNAEVIYDWLLKQAKKNKQQNGQSGMGTPQSDSNQSSSSSSSGKSQNQKNRRGQTGQNGDSDEDDESNSGNKNSKSSTNPEKGYKTGKLKGQFDSHKYGNKSSSLDNGNEDNGNGQDNQQNGDDGSNGQDESQDQNDGQNDGDSSNGNSNGKGKGKGKGSKNPFGISDRWGDVGTDPDFSPKVSKEFAENMREAVISEIQRTERTQGYVPAGLDGLLNEIKKPEIKWQEVLAQFVTTVYNGKRRWLPPSRRHVYNEIYLQSRRNEKINVTVAIDTSGSCVGDLPKFFGELISLLKTFGSYDLHVIQCDAQVDKYDHYDDGANPFDVENTKEIKWSGGGGTSFKPPFKFVREKNIQTDCFIYFTDSYGDAPTYPPPYPVLWILTADGNEKFCPWGQKIKFKSREFSN